MASHFGWVDFTEDDRKRMLDVVQLFRESGTRDELGIGTIRDAFADHFFPGTSTIQTRVRYMLFIPWIYHALEQKGVAAADFARRARAEEVRLISALLASKDTEGIIGREARASLRRLPSSVYWSALGSWGIRLFTGSQDQYVRNLGVYYRRQRGVVLGDDREPLAGRPAENWHPGLPKPPADFPQVAGFALTVEEARYLREQILTRYGESLLAMLVDQDQPLDADYPWEAAALLPLTGELQATLVHARNFSETIYGAALLYNLMLAEKREVQEWVDGYQADLTDWASLIQARWNELSAWHRTPDTFWDSPALRFANIPYRTRQFVQQWLNLMFTDSHFPGTVLGDRGRQLIHDREIHLKGPRARLENSQALKLWLGAAGAFRLDYRWPRARIFAREIIQGLTQEEA